MGLEAYPGLLARSVLGTTSYKSDDKAKQTPGRLIARKTLVNALENGQAPLLQACGLRCDPYAVSRRCAQMLHCIHALIMKQMSPKRAIYALRWVKLPCMALIRTN